MTFYKKNSNKWIINSGASHHMPGDVNLLSNVREIVQCLVGLLNKINTIALKKRKLCLENDIYVNHILFVPNMNCTLIFVVKLLQLNCIINFTDRLYVILDQTLRTLIGAGEQCGGVYHFIPIAPMRANKVVE